MSPSLASFLHAAAASLIIRTASTQVLGTVNPCPQDPAVTPITVTAQYHPASTCYPVDVCNLSGTCSQTFGYETYQYVSTVIPCAVMGSLTSSCTITSTREIVVLATATETITNIVPIPTPNGKEGRYGQRPAMTTIYDVRNGRKQAHYNQVGPLAIAGYAGSGLCYDCIGPNGIWEQQVDIIECRHLSNESSETCVEYSETWTSFPPPPPVSATAICSTQYSAPSAGTYTFVFEEELPAQTMSAPAETITVVLENGRPGRHVRPARTWTAPPCPWAVTVYKSCSGPTVIDFTTTVTTTTTVVAPIVTTTVTGSTTTTTSNTIGPISGSTTMITTTTTTTTTTMTTTISNTVQPISGSTTSNSTTSTSTSTISSVTSSSSITPISTSSVSIAPTSLSTTTGGSSSTTSTSSSPTTSTSVTFSQPFFIRTQNTNPGVKKRDIQYVGFDGNDNAIVGSDTTIDPAEFILASNGSLYDYCTSEFVGTASATGLQPISIFTTNPAGAQIWTESPSQQLTLALAIDFCVLPDSTLQAVFTSGVLSQYNCTEVDLFVTYDLEDDTTSTTSASSTSATTSTSSTSSSPSDAPVSTTTSTSSTSDSMTTTSSTITFMSSPTTTSSSTSGTTTTISTSKSATTSTSSSMMTSTTSSGTTTTTITSTTTTTTTSASPTPDASDCPGIPNPYTAQNGEQFKIDCKHTYYYPPGGSNIITTVSATSLANCLEICSTTGGCVLGDFFLLPNGTFSCKLFKADSQGLKPTGVSYSGVSGFLPGYPL